MKTNIVTQQEIVSNVSAYLQKKFPKCKVVLVGHNKTDPSAQQILKLLDKNWKSFFIAIKDFSKNKNKYLGKPKLPSYKKKDGRGLLILTNQNCRLIDMIKYKSENYGVTVITTEESYTSGTSFLDNEYPIKANYNKTRRIHRGLFVSNRNIKINADVNGSYQIMKKVFPNVFADGIEGVVLHPIRVTIM